MGLSPRPDNNPVLPAHERRSTIRLLRPSRLTRQQLGAFVEKMVLEADAIFARTQDSSRWPVQPGSSLARDDRDTDPYHLSHAVRGGISSSAEHLHAFRTLLVGAAGVKGG